MDSQLLMQTMTKFQQLEFSIPSTIEEAIYLQQQRKLVPQYEIQVWTDGSLFQEYNTAAAGWIYVTGNKITTGNSKVWPSLSSFYAECAAMILGIDRLLNDPEVTVRNKSVGLFTDSHSLCDYLQRICEQDCPAEVHTQSLIDQLIILLDLADQVVLHWIPGHQGLEYNELADEEAKNGHKSDDTYYFPLTRRWIKKVLRNEINAVFHKYLKDNIKDSNLNPSYPNRHMFIEPRTRKSPTRRNGGEALFHLQTGHTYLKSHQILVSNDYSDDLCRWCQTHPETPEHVILHCNNLPRIPPSRQNLLQYCTNSSLNIELGKNNEEFTAILKQALIHLGTSGVKI